MFSRKFTGHTAAIRVEAQAVPKKFNEKSMGLNYSPVVRRPAGYPAFHPESGNGKTGFVGDIVD